MSDLQKVAYVFLIIATVISGFAILPLAWCIPMCIHYKKNNGHVGVGFKVCTLLFVSIVSGILMLCDGENN